MALQNLAMQKTDKTKKTALDKEAKQNVEMANAFKQKFEDRLKVLNEHLRDPDIRENGPAVVVQKAKNSQRELQAFSCEIEAVLATPSTAFSTDKKGATKMLVDAKKTDAYLEHIIEQCRKARSE